ncbi:MAG: CHAD domain-containing protein [Euryarchaeota archaeon]|nr:CHAD domain-containing protein [Euryarchaeota archaeon]
MARADTSDHCRFAARTMLRQLAELESEMNGATEGDDVEFVHRSRVASRRLRASLTIFEECCPRGEHKGWTKGIKRVTRSLGAARDLDVQIDFLRGYIDRDVGDASLHRLLSTLCRKRADAQKGVDGSLEALRRSGVPEGIREWASELDVERELELGTIRRKALLDVLARRDELYAFDRFVPDPDAFLKHHEMRIAGKHLRYTLEIFSTCYAEGLKGYIKRLKEMQDVLGEMHDCDVWSELLRKRRGAGSLRLMADRSERRSQLYAEFVVLWQELRDVHLPDMERMMRESVAGPGADLEGHEGRVGLISDVHGNLPALRSVLLDAEMRGATVFLNAGDSVGAAPFNKETIDDIMFREVISVVGNYDREMLGSRGTAERGYDEKGSEKTRTTRSIVSGLKDEEAIWLETLNEALRLNVGGKRLLLTHGSPASIDEKVTLSTPEARMNELSEIARTDVVVHGHSHEQMDRAANGTRFINPGSVGRQVDGDPRSSYAIWDTASGTADFYRVAYPVHEVLDRMTECGWPKEEGIIYLRGCPAGRSCDRPIGGEDEKWVDMAVAALNDCGQNVEHPMFVRKLAIKLFRELGKGLGLKRSDLPLLECAAVLHDIGMMWGMKGHNRSSFDLIVMSRHLKVPFDDKMMIANIARYHRGPGPKRSHGNLLPLERPDIERMSRLASLLRIADGLDYGHTQRIRVRKVSTIRDCVSIELANGKGFEAEIGSARKKSDLYRSITGREVEIS